MTTDRTELREKIEAAIDECRYGDLVAGGYRYDRDKLRDRIMTLVEPLVGALEEYGDSVQYAQSGVDVHGGLRVRLEYEKATRTIVAKHSAETGVDVVEDVRQAIVEADRRAGFLRAWLRAALAQERGM